MMGLPMHHCQPKPQPLSIGLSSETDGHADTQESKKLTNTSNKNQYICKREQIEVCTDAKIYLLKHKVVVMVGEIISSAYLLAAEGDFATIMAFL